MLNKYIHQIRLKLDFISTAVFYEGLNTYHKLQLYCLPKKYKVLLISGVLTSSGCPLLSFYREVLIERSPTQPCKEGQLPHDERRELCILQSSSGFIQGHTGHTKSYLVILFNRSYKKSYKVILFGYFF